MRDFEKINIQQFRKDINQDTNLYDSYLLPRRTSNHAAGYDFFLIQDITVQPGEELIIPTGIKARFQSNEVLLIIIRHSLGYKYNVRLCNQIGVIDSDYYHSENDGHIFIKIKNEGDRTFSLKAGESVVQGIFTNFLITDSDSPINRRRIDA